MTTRRARIFVSCGQNKKSDEVDAASLILNELTQLGFDPYVAVEEQTLRGIIENIFSQLQKSEYCIFIDFKREQLAGQNPTVCRGSLFSHQELAIAAFLKIPVIAFQETGTKQDDGLLKFLQANAISFSDRSLLPGMVSREVVKRGWDPLLRNELVLRREPRQHVDSYVGRDELGRFFHLSAHNLHHQQSASNCYAYLQSAVRLQPETTIPLNTIELKWAGYTLPNAHITPKSQRRIDAFWVHHNHPTVLQFNTYSDSTEFIPQIQGEGQYLLEYAVTSDNFPPSQLRLKLNLSATLGLTTLLPCD